MQIEITRERFLSDLKHAVATNNQEKIVRRSGLGGDTLSAKQSNSPYRQVPPRMRIPMNYKPIARYIAFIASSGLTLASSPAVFGSSGLSWKFGVFGASLASLILVTVHWIAKAAKE